MSPDARHGIPPASAARVVRRIIVIGLSAIALAASSRAAETTNPPAPTAPAAPGARTLDKPAPEKTTFLSFLGDMLPRAWQSRPQMRFNVYTEMTPAGREWRVPTPEKPLRYYAQPARFVQMGWQPAAGEKPPPGPELEAAMRKALAEIGYVLIPDDNTRPELLLVLSYGSHGADFGSLAPIDLGEGDLPPPPTSAEELLPYVRRDPSAIRDVIDRARFIAGEPFARALQSAMVGPMADFQFFLSSGDSSRTRDLVEMAFNTCYWVIATAYDFRGVEQKQKIPLWQTRMTVEAQGVSMAEVMKPLIVNTAPFLGRETTEPVVVTKRISREGRVEIGTPSVVEDPKPGTTPPAGR